MHHSFRQSTHSAQVLVAFRNDSCSVRQNSTEGS